jgi:hypothetical protein
MATFGFPADYFAQSHIRPLREPAPPAPTASEGSSQPSASSPPVPHDEATAWEAPVVTALPIRAMA